MTSMMELLKELTREDPSEGSDPWKRDIQILL